jgi:hypothetical protein
MADKPKVVVLAHMRYEVAKSDRRGRPSYVWCDGYLAQTADGNNVYPPCSWQEAVAITKENHKGTEVTVLLG